MLLFFTVLVIAGSLGGLIYALESDSAYDHNLCIPWDGKEINTGWLGHVIVGIGGAIVTIGAAIPVFRMDITPIAEYHLLVEQPPSNTSFNAVIAPAQQPLSEGLSSVSGATANQVKEAEQNTSITPKSSFTKKDTLELILYMLALGIIGGYSGLRIISGMSDAMIKKLEKEVDDKVKKSTQTLQKENQKIRDSVAVSLKKDRELKSELDKQKDSNNLIKAAFLIKTGKAGEGVEILKKQREKTPKNDKVIMWLGSGYRQLKKYSDALQCALDAVQLDPEEWAYSYNCACYLSLTEKPEHEETIVNHLKDAIRKYKNDSKNESNDIIEGLLKEDGDKDLNFIRQKVDILALLNQD
ncbi:putative TPR_REGION domain-containing protein [Vibrio chagasii]|nr:putative TPR_REGION domain-containing protein [Vibrio chagasii]CAH6876802.1 putative TPR_REGION domain-containing protein [Vibrio chagasii]CAH6879004.1 putative TPR_REGION domain-containing protein [Vibrio chagasii]CAH6879663.1 putative TPR_REGION domain-containing protein [Vibrio chagasii]CAH7107578.1 putative TPR_REGION domain-containing protein [Vibrio chagasii]